LSRFGSPVLLVVRSLAKGKFLQCAVGSQALGENLKAIIGDNSNIKLFNCFAIVGCLNDSLKTSFTQIDSFKIKLNKATIGVGQDGFTDIFSCLMSKLALFGLLG